MFLIQSCDGADRFLLQGARACLLGHFADPTCSHGIVGKVGTNGLSSFLFRAATGQLLACFVDKRVQASVSHVPLGGRQEA